MRRYVTVVALLATFAWAGTAGAQELGIGVHAGYSQPLGVYGDDFGAEAAGARPGFTLGVDALYPVEQLTERLGWYSSLSLIRNGTEGSQDRTGSFVNGSFTLVPVMTGVRLDLGSVPNLFVSGQGGLLLVRGPEDFYPWGFPDGPSIGVQFGYNVGLGFQVSDLLSVTAKYFPLGTIDFEYGDSEPLRQEVNFLDIQLGFRVK